MLRLYALEIKVCPAKTVASAKVLPKLKEGKLTRYGYRADKSAKKRLAALSKSVRGVGYVKTIRRVVAIRNYSEHDPKLLKIYETDIKNLHNKYRKKSKKSSRRRRKSSRRRKKSSRRRPRKSSRRRKKSSRRRPRKSSRRRKKSSRKRKKSSRKRKKSSRRRPRKSSRRRKKSSRRRPRKSSKKYKFLNRATDWLLGTKHSKKAKKRKQISEWRKSSEKIRGRIKRSGPRWGRAHRRKRSSERQRRMEIPYNQARREARNFLLKIERQKRVRQAAAYKRRLQKKMRLRSLNRLKARTRGKSDFRRSSKARHSGKKKWYSSPKSRSPPSYASAVRGRAKQPYSGAQRDALYSSNPAQCKRLLERGLINSTNWHRCVKGEGFWASSKK